MTKSVLEYTIYIILIIGVYMEKLKKQIIKLLTEDARYSYAQLSDIIGAPVSDVETAVKDLENRAQLLSIPPS